MLVLRAAACAWQTRPGAASVVDFAGGVLQAQVVVETCADDSVQEALLSLATIDSVRQADLLRHARMSPAAAQ
jgi:hypothetical protein